MLKQLLITLALLASSGLSFVAHASSSPVDVVKIINFDCAVCKASNHMDGPIKAAVESAGGIFDIAPIPRPDTNWRERFYYVLRSYGPSVERTVRDSFFAGSQEYNYPLMDIPEIMDWLRENTHLSGINWAQVLVKVKSPASLEPVNRALQLVAESGARLTPTYILIRNGRILNSYDIASVPNQNLSSLRETVLEAVNKANLSNSEK